MTANALQKQLVRDGVPVRRLWLATHAWMLLPALAIAAFQPFPVSIGFWRDAAIAGLLDALGNLAMVAALRSTDLSVFGPLNALRPLLALAFGWMFLGEHPTAIGLAGVGVTAGGAAWLLAGRDATAGKRDPGGLATLVGLRVVGLALSSVGAVFLKRAADHGGTGWTQAVWVAAGSALLAAVTLPDHRSIEVSRARASTTEHTEITEAEGTLRKNASFRDFGSFRGQNPKLMRDPSVVALHAALFLAMQWSTVAIFRGTLLAYSFVFFQLGMVLQVVVGRVLFGEPAFGRRLAACLAMSIGAGLVLWRG